MKKISSILVLMLIALMLFVSCNNNTPTKEESNSSSNDSSNGSTPTVTERAVTDDDFNLFITLDKVIIKENLFYKYPDQLPGGCSRDQKGGTNILNFYQCELDHNALDVSPLHVKLNGIATFEPKLIGENNNVSYYTFNFTEGSSHGNTQFTMNIEFNINDSNEYDFTSVTINEEKITGLTELFKTKNQELQMMMMLN